MIFQNIVLQDLRFNYLGNSRFENHFYKRITKALKQYTRALFILLFLLNDLVHSKLTEYEPTEQPRCSTKQQYTRGVLPTSSPGLREKPWGRGWGTPLYKPCRCVPPQGVGFFRRFGLKTGIHFVRFGLESGMVFKRSTGV